MEKGTVEFWNYKNGYGFIKTEDGVSLFVHRSALVDAPRLKKGTAVTFDVGEHNARPCAVNVTRTA